MRFLVPSAFLGGLIAIPIILLYMLRLRRREVTVSSIFLWQQILQDQEANTPWQRLRRNLLLLLQLLLLALLVFSLARPFMIVPAVGSGQITLLLDASASMNAADIDEEKRFDVAKREALSIIDTLRDGDRMTVIRVADVPEILASSTSDRSRLRHAVQTAQPDGVQSDWDAALNLAAAGSANTEDFTIVIIGDGGIPDTAGIPGIDGDLRYIPVGVADDNVAITALATRVLPGESPEMFAQITNYGDTEARIVLSLFVDGERFTTSNEVIPAGGNLPVISSALPEGFQTLEASLTQSVNALSEDYLRLDDAAYAVFSTGEDRRVLLVTEGNLFIEQVLRSLPNINAIRTDGRTGIPDQYDIYIFDNFVPDVLPDGDMMFINPQENTSLFILGAESKDTANPVVNIHDDRTQFVDIEQLNLLNFRQVGGVDWADPLISVRGGPLLLVGEVNGQQVALMPFDLRNSDLPLQITWPILMANLMEWFTPRSVITITDSINVGESLSIHPPLEADTVRIILPDDTVRHLPVERQSVAFAETHTAGIYTLELLDGDEVINTQSFAVNLFSALESDIAPVAQNALTIDGTTIVSDEIEELGQREFWPWVTLAALIILMIEWYAYHQRLGTPTIFRPLRRTSGVS